MQPSTQKILALIILLLGILLAIYMIAVESEPGALPLFLILFGAIWFLVNRFRMKKHLGKK